MGASAVRGKDGVVDTTRLLRQSPFGEWVNVFYDPSKIKPAEMLQLIKKNDCPRARHTTVRNKQLLNPIIAPGDPVQINFSASADTSISDQSKLPNGWKIAGSKKLSKGENFVTLSVPRSTKQGSHTVKISTADGQSVELEVIVVSQVGRH